MTKMITRFRTMPVIIMYDDGVYNPDKDSREQVILIMVKEATIITTVVEVILKITSTLKTATKKNNYSIVICNNNSRTYTNYNIYIQVL